MSQIQAKPKHLFSWGFVLSVNHNHLVTMDVSFIREGGQFIWNNNTYQLSREGFYCGDFLLLKDNEIIARASKPNPFTRRFVLGIGNREIVLAANSPFTRCFHLTENNMTIGSISPNHPFTRRTTIELPDDMDIPIQVFIFWLVVLMWRRASNSNAANS